MTFFANFKRSALELKNLRTLCVTAILIALDLVLKLLKIYIPPNIKISCAFIAVASIGMLFGPTVAAFACAITDIVGFLMAPDGGFSILFTLVEVTGGVLYACFLYNFEPIKPDYTTWKTFGKSIYQQKFSFLRIVGAILAVSVVCNLIMTPAALQLSLGQFVWEEYFAALSVRVLTNAIAAPVRMFLLMITLSPIKSAYNTVFKPRIKNTF